MEIVIGIVAVLVILVIGYIAYSEMKKRKEIQSRTGILRDSLGKAEDEIYTSQKLIAEQRADIRKKDSIIKTYQEKEKAQVESVKNLEVKEAVEVKPAPKKRRAKRKPKPKQ